ncbi:MAG: hypothetical protein QXP36_15340 [Conexivisphaerales archaeon]|uniref:hypothetical protein n=1 Tax=Saccharolobus sp. TaxID=2100761 RepID=UPI00316377AD
MQLEKYFTPEEIQFITSIAKEKNLKEMDVIISLAREMIQTYNLRYVNGQQVLALMDLLAMKLPSWFAIQTEFMNRQAMTFKTTANLMSNLFGTKQDVVDTILRLLNDPSVSRLLNNLLPLVSLLASKPSNLDLSIDRNEQEDNRDDKKDDDLL